MNDEKTQKKPPLAVWLTIGICVIIIILIVILMITAKNKRIKRLESYLESIYKYCDERYPYKYYLDSSDKMINVHIWQSGAALSVTMSGEQQVRDYFEGFAKDLYTSLEKRDLSLYYDVSLFLHNDLNTEKVLMWWINGEYQKSDWADSGFR